MHGCRVQTTQSVVKRLYWSDNLHQNPIQEFALRRQSPNFEVDLKNAPETLAIV